MSMAQLAKRIRGSIRGRLLFSPGLGPILSGIQRRDDFDWDSYSRMNYGPSLIEFEKHFTSRLSGSNWKLEKRRVVPSGRPLHPRHRLIYELALELNPDSIFECGFGGGDHLANLSILLPDADIGGADISSDQRDLAIRRSPKELTKAKLHVLDLTQANSVGRLANTAEFVYCQAVIMHIHGQDRHLRFIENMWSLSNRYLLFVESWQRHGFVGDLRSLLPGSLLYRVGGGASSGILIDKKNALSYPVIRSEREIREHVRVG